MPDDHLRSAIDSIRAQIQAELETQLGALERQHSEALESARKRERADADQHWTDELNRMEADWEGRLRSALAEAAADADGRIQAETDRVRREMEGREQQSLLQAREQAASSVAQVRAELEQARKESDEALVAERSRHAAEQEARAERIGHLEKEAERIGHLEKEIEGAQERAQELQNELTVERAHYEQALAAARESLEAEAGRVSSLTAELNTARQALEETRLAFDTERSAARQALEEERVAARTAAEAEAVRQRDAAEAQRVRDREAAEARAAERQSQLAVTERLLRSVNAIGDAQSLTEVLTSLVKCAAVEASRAAVLIPSGEALQGLAAIGFGSVPASDRAEGVLDAAIRERQRMAITPAAAPAFAALPGDRAGLAVPILVGGQAVALLYADNGLAESPEVPASWPEVVEILCAHASAVLSQLTAVRTTQAMRLMRPAAYAGPAGQNSEALGEEDQAARRYARLLVYEIKLYNESAVRIGREKRDLLVRLRPEVDRARRLYEARVPTTVAARAQYFEQELRQTLAGGDASLLGDPVVIP